MKFYTLATCESLHTQTETHHWALCGGQMQSTAAAHTCMRSYPTGSTFGHRQHGIIKHAVCVCVCVGCWPQEKGAHGEGE